MIEARNLTKRYGAKLAVDDLTFTAHPGTVTGFLGPNGAGKSTTMRMILGLDAPSSGTVTVNGKHMREHARPLREIGALLEARAVHTGRSARNHLLAQAATTGVPTSRVDEIIDRVGLLQVAHDRAGTFSLGMGQRIGLASALLADPRTLVLDEPVNGLDPNGVRWIRQLLKDFAARGRTVLLSSHLMSEMALTADRVIVIGKGRLLRDQSMAEFIEQASTRTVRVRSPEADRLRDLLDRPGVSVHPKAADQFVVEGIGAEHIGTVAARAAITLYELAPQEPSLEDAYMALTGDHVEHRSHSAPADRVTSSRGGSA